jgi:poly-gamma-glutamate synthesis protein (capsule biosynthesis protein)
MEFTLAGEPYTGYPGFSAPDSYAEYLARCGFDIFLCANNHIYDKGSKGAARTLEIYQHLNERYGIQYIGLAESPEEREDQNPFLVVRKGIRLALINTTYGTNLGATDHWPKVLYQSEKSVIESALSKADSRSDFSIIFPHWGNEYELTHSEDQEEVARWLAEEGVDIIIGTHPHVVQDTASVEGNSHYGRTQIAYSLGNAVSNMSAANTQLELMVTARIVRHFNGDIEILPNELTFLWCSRPGGYNGSYTVLPVVENMSGKAEWQNPYDHENMVRTYRRVLEKTGIEENIQDINE